MAARSLQLPQIAVSPGDIRRLRRELDSLDDYLHQASLRQPETVPRLPRLSRSLSDTATINELNLGVIADRNNLKTFLDNLLDHAPVLHISFAVDPSSAFLVKVVDWLRQNIDKYLLVDVGLEPNIAAGCIVRTTNKMFDLSLREHFAKQRNLLIKKITEEAPAA